jgi:outer membrane murein-binding lipoprotein Lpp
MNRINENTNNPTDGPATSSEIQMKKKLDQLSTQLQQLKESHDTRIERLATDVKHLSSEVDHLKFFRADIVRMRRTILDNESDLRIPIGDRRTRNALAHGGNLLADVEAIRSIETSDPDRFCYPSPN